jgi:hypothetical protein
MATAKKTTTPAAKKAAPAKSAAPAKKAAPAKTAAPAKKATRAAAPAPAAAPLKPIKTAFNKTSLIAHLADVAAVDLKAVKAVCAALEGVFAAKPASVKIRTRALKKLKDAAL